MNSKSIRFKLIAWYAALLVGLFILLGIGGYEGFNLYLQRITKDALVRRSRLIASTLQVDIEKQGEHNIVDDITKYYAPEVNGRFLRITRSDGSLLYVSGLPHDGSFDPSLVSRLKLPIAGAYFRQESVLDGDDMLIYTLPINLHNGKSFFIESGVSTEQIAGPLRGLLAVLGFLLPVVLLCAIGGGYLLVRRALIPVDELTKAAARITSENLKERLPVNHTGDELERLSISLNNMIIRLEKAIQHSSQFTADASHELRTPLTVLQCELETIIQKPRIDNEMRERIGSALGETERLAKIVEGLLTISRLDAGEARMEKSTLNLAELTAATVEQMRLLAEDKNISLYCFISPKIFITGDAHRLKQVIVNLLDNAVKYTLQGGQIKVNVSAEADHAILMVTDTGIGIPTNVQPHIFERFYRADKVRSREEGGAGLGLSIVKSICLAHGGDISVISKENEGSCFSVSLPLATYQEDGNPKGQISPMGIFESAPHLINAEHKLT